MATPPAAPAAPLPALPALPRTRLGRLLIGRPRLFISVAAAVATYAGAILAGPADMLKVTALLIGWNAGTVLYIALNVAAMAQASEHSIRRRARLTDEGRFAILVLVSAAALASMGAILVELGLLKALHGVDKALHLALAAGTILSAWVFIHLVFALHYAHEYFDEAQGASRGAPPSASQGSSEDALQGAAQEKEGTERPAARGGLRFPGQEETGEEPGYWDFVYFSFVIGVAAQTADVEITARAMRLTSLGHSVLSFFFNSAILALTINIAAGLL